MYTIPVFVKLTLSEKQAVTHFTSKNALLIFSTDIMIHMKMSFAAGQSIKSDSANPALLHIRGNIQMPKNEMRQIGSFMSSNKITAWTLEVMGYQFSVGEHTVHMNFMNSQFMCLSKFYATPKPALEASMSFQVCFVLGYVFKNFIAVFLGTKGGPFDILLGWKQGPGNVQHF